MITINSDDGTFQVSLQVKDGSLVYILVLSGDQQQEFYREIVRLSTYEMAVNYKNDFTKSDAKRVVNRYLKPRR